jgi:hypothetical protein
MAVSLENDGDLFIFSYENSKTIINRGEYWQFLDENMKSIGSWKRDEEGPPSPPGTACILAPGETWTIEVTSAPAPPLIPDLMDEDMRQLRWEVERDRRRRREKKSIPAVEPRPKRKIALGGR